MQKLVAVRLLGASPHMGDMYQFGVLPITFFQRNAFIQTSLQVTPLNRFSRAICQNAWFRGNCIPLGVKNDTFWKFKMAAAAILENTQKGVSGPILDQFTPNLCADKYGEYKAHKRPIIALFCKFMMAARFLGIQNGVAAILNKIQLLLVYLGQYCI